MAPAEPPRLIVWDFDGVLNANTRDGRFLWADSLKADLGVDPAEFARDLFGSGRIRDVMRGRDNLLTYTDGWLRARGYTVSGTDFLAYWFEKDRHPDGEVIGWLEAAPTRRVIGTNNEAHRAAFIEAEMGFGDRVEKIFASGRMGVAKPDPGFFAEVERWADLTPANILLIDDTAANVAAAMARGWRGFHFNPASRAELPGVIGL